MDQHKKLVKQCPYLSTIRKHLLDFDFEKICCISLNDTNIYACLVCGRYFEGRQTSSHAYQHSIEFSHYVFMNLQNSKVYCLPDNYEVDSYTLSDIKFNLNPTYTLDTLRNIQKMQSLEYNVDGKEFIPGVVGINNIGSTDYATSVIYLLNSLKQIRYYFLINSNFNHNLISQFGLLLRKIWNPKNFKGVVSPHEFLQAVTNFSQKKFKIGKQSDPVAFMLWLVDTMSKNIRKKQKKSNFELQNLFKGKLKVSILKGIQNSYEYQQQPSKVEQINFSILRFDFPQQGIFNKSKNEVKLEDLLGKYLGKEGEKHPQGLRFAKITEFPQYLVFVFLRFKNNGFSIEKDSSHLLYRSLLQIQSHPKNVCYQLLAQICHTGGAETGKYQSVFKIGTKWFEVEDLQAKQILEKQAMLTQPYIQIYEMQKIL